MAEKPPQGPDPEPPAAAAVPPPPTVAEQAPLFAPSIVLSGQVPPAPAAKAVPRPFASFSGPPPSLAPRLPTLPSWPQLPGPIVDPMHDRVARTWFFALLIGLGLTVANLFQVFLSDFLMAILIGSLLRPIQNTLLKGMRPWVAASLMCAVAIVLMVGPMVYLAIALSTEAAALFDPVHMTGSMDRINGILFGEGWVAGRARAAAQAFGVAYTPETVKGFLLGGIATVAKFLYDQVNSILSNFLIFLFHLIIFVVCLFYFLLDGHRFRQFVQRNSPLPDDEDDMIIARFQAVGRAILWGNGIGSLVQGVFGGIALYLAGLPSPILWATVMAFAAFLPMVGISLVTVPATAYLVLDGRYGAALLFFLSTSIVSFVFEHIVKTKLIGSSVRMHDAIILLSILAGLSVFGLMGLLYGPLVVALFLVLLELYHARYRTEVVGPNQVAKS